MLMLLFVVTFFFQTNAYSRALAKCGDDPLERKYNLIWLNLGESKADSPYGAFGGLLCAGIHLDGKSIMRINYREQSGLKKTMSIKELLTSDKKLIVKTDAPRIAWPLLRSTPILSLRVIQEVVHKQKTKYIMSFKFLRNIGKGMLRPEIKDLIFKTELDHRSQILKSWFENVEFDKITLKVSPGLKIIKVHFVYNSKYVLSHRTSQLPTGIRRY